MTEDLVVNRKGLSKFAIADDDIGGDHQNHSFHPIAIFHFPGLSSHQRLPSRQDKTVALYHCYPGRRVLSVAITGIRSPLSCTKFQSLR
jgi:hypothetical protein